MNGNCRQWGLSLIELMVSIALGLVLILAIVQVMFTTKSSYLLERESALLQENARFAMEFLRSDALKAGFTGCAPTATFANVVVDPSEPDNWEKNEPGIYGYDHADEGNFPDAIDSVAGGERWANTDAFATLYLEREYSGAPTAAEKAILDAVQLAGVESSVDPGQITPGDGIAIVDESCNVFAQLESSGPAALLTDIAYGYAVTAGNCDLEADQPGSAVTCPLVDPATLIATGAIEGVKVLRAEAAMYYIKPSIANASVPALFRLPRNGTEEELVQGVENLQILYGYDTDATRDGIPNYYLPAGDTSYFSPWDWERVVSIRIALLMRSINTVEYETQSVADFEGVSIADDRYLRQRVVSVVQLKNRAYY